MTVVACFGAIVADHRPHPLRANSVRTPHLLSLLPVAAPQHHSQSGMM